MRNGIRSIGIISVVTFLAIICSCSDSHSQWQGTVEEVDGVAVVRNPIDPIYGEFVPVIEEEFRIGNKNDDNYLFYRVRGIALDSEDNIFVVDMGNSRIQKFNKEGQYLQTIGRKGQGPGEFQAPLGICVDIHNNFYVPEYKKINMFDKQGDFQRSVVLDYHLIRFAVDSDGHFVGYSDLQQRETARRAIVKVDTEGKVVETFVEYKDLGIKIVIGENATFTLSPNHVYSPRLVFASIAQDVYAYGYSSEYLINIIDKEGNPLLKIYKSDDPIPIAQKEKAFIIDGVSQTLERRQIPISKQMIEETMHFEETRAFFYSFLTDDEKRLYVQRVKDVLDETKEFEFDVFSYSGYYLYTVRFPFVPDIIRYGRIYDFNTDEETGDVMIRCHRIVNWAMLKKDID